MNSSKIDVLDHGYVRLVDHMGSDLSIVRSARTSYDAAWRAGEDAGSDERLIKYLWKNKHSTPFESVAFTFEVKAPIFVLRQWMRHRTWAFNEQSARYTEVKDEYYLPDPHLIGVQSKNNKQARDIADLDASDLVEKNRQINIAKVANEAAFANYRKLLAAGWPRELARTVLPVATYSHMFATVNLLNLFKFITLRDDAHAQYEIQVYARAMQDLITPIVPVAVKYFEDSRQFDN